MKHFSRIFLSALFALTLTPQAFAAHTIDKTIVSVNDEIILESDIDKFMEKMKSKSYQELFGGVDPRATKDRESALQLLVEEKIINQQVKKLELQVNDQEVDGQIRAIVKRNGITTAQLEERLKQLGTSMHDYKDGIRRQLERKNLMDREIKPSFEVTEEQLKHYYMRNSKPTDQQMEYKIAHIMLAKKPGKVSVEERAKQVYAEVQKSPDDFGKLAKEYSDDASTAGSDGVLGYFGTNSLSKEFRQAVLHTPVGQITKPIKTSSGIHIIRVLESKTSDFASMPKERKEMLRTQMISEELEKKMSLWIERKKSEANIKRFN